MLQLTAYPTPYKSTTPGWGVVSARPFPQPTVGVSNFRSFVPLFGEVSSRVIPAPSVVATPYIQRVPLFGELVAHSPSFSLAVPDPGSNPYVYLPGLVPVNGAVNVSRSQLVTIVCGDTLAEEVDTSPVVIPLVTPDPRTVAGPGSVATIGLNPLQTTVLVKYGSGSWITAFANGIPQSGWTATATSNNYAGYERDKIVGFTYVLSPPDLYPELTLIQFLVYLEDYGKHNYTYTFSFTTSAAVWVETDSALGKTYADHLGGDHFVLYGNHLASFVADDDFSGVALSSLWSAHTSGSGSISTGVGLLCDTGFNSGSKAGVVGTYLHGSDFDFMVGYAIQTDFLADPPPSMIKPAVFEVVKDVHTYCRISHVYNAAEFGNELVVDVCVNDQLFTRTVPVSGLTGVMRVVRTGSRLLLLHSDALLLDWPSWCTNIVTVNFRMDNVSAPYRMRGVFSDFKRNPLVTFGGEPALSLSLITTRRILGTVPPYPNMPADTLPVDVYVSNALSNRRTTAGITYVVVDQFAIQFSSSTLKILDDEVLRNVEEGSPGFERGGPR